MPRSLWVRATQLASVMRLKPFEVSTLAGRSRERDRRVALSALAAMGAKGISVLTILVSVPLTVGYLGVERYGLWMTMSSMIAVLQFADLGMGNGLTSAISEANGKDDRRAALNYVSSTYFMLSGLTILLAAVFAAVYSSVPWQRVFNVSSPEAVAEAGPAMAVFAGCFLLNVPLGIVQRVQLGYQEGFVNSLWLGLGSILGLGGVLLAIYFNTGLPWLVLAMAGAPVLAAFLNGVVLFGFKRPWLRPRWKSVTGTAAGRILKLGLLFFVLQVAIALGFSSDNIVIAHFLGPEAVSTYSVAMRMFSITSVMLGMMLVPLWPAYGESLSRGDIAWIKRTLSRTLAMALLFSGLTSVFLIVFGVQIIRVWAGAEVVPSFFLLLGLGVWTVMAAAGNIVAVFLNAASILRVQVVCAVLWAGFALLLKVLLAPVVGLPGVIWGTVIAYVIFTAVPISIYIPRLLSAMEQRERKDQIT